MFASRTKLFRCRRLLQPAHSGFAMTLRDGTVDATHLPLARLPAGRQAMTLGELTKQQQSAKLKCPTGHERAHYDTHIRTPGSRRCALGNLPTPDQASENPPRRSQAQPVQTQFAPLDAYDRIRAWCIRRPLPPLRGRAERRGCLL